MKVYGKIVLACALMTVTALLCMDSVSKRAKNSQLQADYIVIETMDADFEVPLSLVRLSHTLTNLLEDAGVDSPIPLPNISSTIWTYIQLMLVHVLELRADFESDDEPIQILTDFLKCLPLPELVELISALNYLDIPLLLTRAMNVLEQIDIKDVPFELLPKDLRAQIIRYHALRILGPVPLYSADRFQGHMHNWVTSLAVTSDGSTLVSGGLDATLRVWNIDSGTQLLEINNPGGAINALCLTLDGKYIIAASDDLHIRLWDINSGLEVTSFTGHTDWIFYIALSFDGKRFTTISTDQTMCTWDIESGQLLSRYEFKFGINAMTESQDRSLIVLSRGDKSKVILFNSSTGKRVGAFHVRTIGISCLAISPDGKHILVGSSDGAIFVFEASTGTLLKKLTGHTAEVNMLLVMPDGRKIVSVSDDGTLRVWDMHLGIQLAQSMDNDRKLLSVCITPDGQQAITGSDTGQVRMWHITGLEGLFTLFSVHAKEAQTRTLWHYLQTDHRAGWRGVQALLAGETLPAVQGTVTFPPYVRVYDLDMLEQELRDLNNFKEAGSEAKRHKSSTDEE